MSYQNDNSFRISLGNIVRISLCNKYDACMHPQWCSWNVLGCDHSNLRPEICTTGGCTRKLHHSCQLGCHERNSVNERPYKCLNCHEDSREEWHSFWMPARTLVDPLLRERFVLILLIRLWPPCSSLSQCRSMKTCPKHNQCPGPWP